MKFIISVMPNQTHGMAITSIAELTTGSYTPPTDSTNLQVTMQHTFDATRGLIGMIKPTKQ